MTHLYLIRHGEARRVKVGEAEDVHLTPLGIKQAEHLRDRLAATGEISADVLIASTMTRARQTAEIIAPALGLPIIFDDEVQEWRPPPGSNVETKEYMEAFKATPDEQKAYYRFAPGAESWVGFMFRACTALNRITYEHEGKTIVVVCHGGIIDASFAFFFRFDTLHFPPAYFNTHNTSITHWKKAALAWLPVAWTLERYNDVMHLRDVDARTRIPWEEISARPAKGTDTPEVPTETQEE